MARLLTKEKFSLFVSMKIFSLFLLLTLKQSFINVHIEIRGKLTLLYIWDPCYCNEPCKEILQNLTMVISKIDGLCSDCVSADILVVNSVFLLSLMKMKNKPLAPYFVV